MSGRRTQKPLTAALFLMALLAAPSFADKEPPIQTMTVPEVSEQAVALDKKTFRLKFHYREAVNQVDASRYWVRVFDLDYSNVVVEFPKEALGYFKKLISEEESYKKFRNTPYYGTSSASASYVYVTARQITNDTKPAYFTLATYNSKTAPMLILDAIGKAASKSISGDVTYKW